MRRYLVTINEKEFTIDLEYRSERYFATINGKAIEIDLTILGESRSLMVANNHAWEIDVQSSGYDTQRVAFMRGMEIPVEVEDYALAQLRKQAGVKAGTTVSKVVKAPMPGLVLNVKVKPGESVVKGQALIVVEAMKMENIIKSQADGVIKSVHVKNGQTVEKNDKLVEFK
jgi:biotin carboxyl carrier protein